MTQFIPEKNRNNLRLIHFFITNPALRRLPIRFKTVILLLRDRAQAS
jgi:hypothetical protein